MLAATAAGSQSAQAAATSHQRQPSRMLGLNRGSSAVFPSTSQIPPRYGLEISPNASGLHHRAVWELDQPASWHPACGAVPGAAGRIASHGTRARTHCAAWRAAAKSRFWASTRS